MAKKKSPAKKAKKKFQPDLNRTTSFGGKTLTGWWKSGR